MAKIKKLQNPFYIGGPVPTELFNGRERELKQIVKRICKTVGAESIAVIGPSQIGKTSLLKMLSSPTLKTKFNEEGEHKYLFCFLDVYQLPHDCTSNEFWAKILQEIPSQIDNDSENHLLEIYKICQEKNFTMDSIQQFLNQAYQNSYRLILLIDEFDALLHYQKLRNESFFSQFRSLISLNNKPIALVLATRVIPSNLDHTVREITFGSPFFNNLSHVYLTTFTDRDVANLLNLGGEKFTASDRQFLLNLCGGHPFLTQKAASILWESYEFDKKTNPSERHQNVFNLVCLQSDNTFYDTWHCLIDEQHQTHKALTAISISQLLGNEIISFIPTFDAKELLENMDAKGIEILKGYNFIEPDENNITHWRIRSQALLNWMSGKIKSTVNANTPFEQWLKEQEVQGLLTVKEKQKLEQNAQVVMGIFQKGITTFVEAVAKGFGETLSS